MNEQIWIDLVVNSFYEKAKTDILIGYHFRNIQDFQSHIPRIVAFWEIQLRGQSEKPIRPQFDVLNAHIPLNIKKGELGRWLLLFKQTLEEQTIGHPEFLDLKDKWLLKLRFFEETFSRFFSFQ